jgi:DegV family protein with EDD domain
MNMGQISIVTDSSAQFLNPEISERKNIRIVPLKFNGPSGLLGEDASTELASIRHHFMVPSTAPTVVAPSVETLSKTYQDLQSTSGTILSIHASGNACNVVANALEASEQFLGRMNIQVIDSQMISIGLGLIVEAAAARAARGENIDALVRLVRGMIPRMYMVVFLEDLMYLERNALINRSQAILGNMLGIIPFLTVEGGHIIPMEKVRSRPRALEKIIEFVSEFSEVEQLVLLYEGEETYAQACVLADRLKVLYPTAPITLLCYNPYLATFVGLGGLGAVVLEPEQEIP